MSEAQIQYRTALDNRLEKCDMMDAEPPDIIQVSRKELEQEHIHLMARIQQLRKLLGFPPLPTGSQLRRQRE